MDKFTKFLKDNKDVFLLFILSRLLLCAILLITRQSYSDVILLFDAEHYRNIAHIGYTEEYMAACFPVIPIIIRYLGDVGMLIINHVAFLFSLYFFKQILIKLKFKTKVSTILSVVAFSPLLLFTSLEYTESLFFFFTILTFYLFVIEANPLILGIVMGLSVATRNTGSLLFFAIFVGMLMKMYQEKSFAKWIRYIVITYIPATIISLIYPVFLQIRFGNWKLFMDCQYGYWLRMKSDIFKTVLVSLKVVFTDEYQFDGAVDTIVIFKINEALSLLLMGLLIFLIIKEAVRMRRASKVSVESTVAIIYSALFLIALCMTIRDPLYNAPTACYYRYYASLFPIYLWIGRFGEKTVQIFMLLNVLLTVFTASLFCLGVFFF